MALALHAPSTAPRVAGYVVGAWMKTMWHDPNGIIYPYDAEDQAIIDAAMKAKAEQDRADCMNMHDE
jgi:hypothetical protein